MSEGVIPKGPSVPADVSGLRKNITVLDCTLRDGGYYNDWDFPTSLIRAYSKSLASAGVDILEMGFRMREADRFLGVAAYSSDRFLVELDIPDTVRVGVMVDAKALLANGDPVSEVRQLFTGAENSPVDLVRVACVSTEVEFVLSGIHQLRTLGYDVGINLMQIAGCSSAEILKFGRQAKTSGATVAYYADSFGGLRPDRVGAITQALGEGFEGPVGCHFHDNLKCALANTQVAMDAGATWVDGTVLGMGRGPGNARIEDLLTVLAVTEGRACDVVPVIDLIEEYFRSLHSRFGWGSNPYYVLSGLLSVHPTYVVEMLRDDRFAPVEILEAIRRLGSEGATKFGRERYEEVLSDGPLETHGTSSVEGWAKGRDVLIIGSGPSVTDRSEDIERFIEQFQPLVIALNGDTPIRETLIDTFAYCQPMMIAADADRIVAASRPILAPRSLLAGLGIDEKRLIDIGIGISPGRFQFGVDSVSVPALLVAAYAFAVASSAGANRLLLCGFDGFPPGDRRQHEMLDVFESFYATEGAPDVIALTPSEYPVKQSSLFAPSWGRSS